MEFKYCLVFNETGKTTKFNKNNKVCFKRENLEKEVLERLTQFKDDNESLRVQLCKATFEQNQERIKSLDY